MLRKKRQARRKGEKTRMPCCEVTWPSLATQLSKTFRGFVGARWLYLIAARPDDIPADTAGPPIKRQSCLPYRYTLEGEKATVKVGIKDEKGRAEKDSSWMSN